MTTIAVRSFQSNLVNFGKWGEDCHASATWIHADGMTSSLSIRQVAIIKAVIQAQIDAIDEEMRLPHWLEQREVMKKHREELVNLLCQIDY